MKTQKGVWIDHRKAIVVTITTDGEEMALVISNVEKQLRRTGDSPMKGDFETRRVPSDDRRQRAYTGHLNIYYDAVIAALSGGSSILIFGPGEAKGELVARLEKCALADCVAAVETTDKMTGRQIAAKVRSYFENLADDVDESRPSVGQVASSSEPNR